MFTHQSPCIRMTPLQCTEQPMFQCLQWLHKLLEYSISILYQNTHFILFSQHYPSVGALLKFGIMVRASAMLISLYDRVLGMFSSRQTNGISWQLFLCLLKIITLPGNSLHAKNILSCQNVFSRVGR